MNYLHILYIISRIFHPGFRKGLNYLEKEEERKRLLEESMQVAEVVQPQKPTNWDVKAVTDEDDL